jgi:short-subunit dehydrogenase
MRHLDRVLRDVTIVVTGARSEAASGIAQVLSSSFNYRLMLIARGPEVHRPSWLSRQDHWISGYDLAHETDVLKLQDHLSEFKVEGKLALLCATGKFVGFTPIVEHTNDQFRQLIESNLLAVHGAARCFLPKLIAQGGGHFITLGSLAAEMAYPYLVPFSSAKMALQYYVKGVANEYSQSGIVATNLALATVNTQEERSLRPFAKHDDWLALEEVAEAVHAVINSPSIVNNGNTVNVYKYSDSYFKDSWFERIGRSEANNASSPEETKALRKASK